MTVNVTIYIGEDQPNGVNVYRLSKETGAVDRSIKIGSGETQTIAVWNETFLEIYEQGPSGEAG